MNFIILKWIESYVLASPSWPLDVIKQENEYYSIAFKVII